MRLKSRRKLVVPLLELVLCVLVEFLIVNLFDPLEQQVELFIEALLVPGACCHVVRAAAAKSEMWATMILERYYSRERSGLFFEAFSALQS